MSKATKFHPFCDGIKHCQKSAWNTPEHLTEQDIETIKQLVPIFQQNDVDAFYALVRSDAAEGMFYRILAWPEGLVYCRDYEYLRLTGFPGMIRHSLSKLEQFLTNK